MIQPGQLVSFTIEGQPCQGIVASIAEGKCAIELRFRGSEGQRFGLKLPPECLTVVNPVPRDLPYQFTDLPLNEFPSPKH